MKYMIALVLLFVVVSIYAEEQLQASDEKKTDKRGIYGLGYGYPALHGYYGGYRGYHGYYPGYYDGYGYGYHGLGLGHGYHGGYVGYPSLSHF
ncbi:glycine-rich protein-like [Condylostylus longicornis]|uniref:glycine-rich protein-like n=1 Tax=Condylostylus longicornis TaxID=2530218 RepID=UPI00244E0748|nr:glycine-rich protein-like [Condylostylus longicornis]